MVGYKNIDHVLLNPLINVFYYFDVSVLLNGGIRESLLFSLNEINLVVRKSSYYGDVFRNHNGVLSLIVW